MQVAKITPYSMLLGASVMLMDSGTGYLAFVVTFSLYEYLLKDNFKVSI